MDEKVPDDYPTLTVPLKYCLSQNYPNPANPITIIEYQLLKAGNVRLLIYNAKGQVVKILVDGMKSAGYHTITWGGQDDYGVDVASGIYLCQMEVTGKLFSKKISLNRHPTNSLT